LEKKNAVPSEKIFDSYSNFTSSQANQSPNKEFEAACVIYGVNDEK
jgi:hypothetical protein